MAPPDRSGISPPTSSNKNQHIVPMPSWSAYVGCTKLTLAVLILVFSAVCLNIWTTQTAFILPLVTALITLLISAYYTIALSYSTRLYHYFAIILLECAGTVLWAASMILLATWTHRHLTRDYMGNIASEHGGQEYLRHLPKELVPAKVASEHFKRYAGKSHTAATRLAGVSAGLSGLQCVLFLVTLVVFARNLREHLTRGHPLVFSAGMTKTARVSSIGSAGHSSQISEIEKEQNERGKEPGRDGFVDATRHLHQGSQPQ